MKKNFNIICSSVVADSYQGDIYDASYYVNFGTLIEDPDYKKGIKLH